MKIEDGAATAVSVFPGMFNRQEEHGGEHKAGAEISIRLGIPCARRIQYSVSRPMTMSAREIARPESSRYCAWMFSKESTAERE
jgi:hypothetical protein